MTIFTFLIAVAICAILLMIVFLFSFGLINAHLKENDMTLGTAATERDIRRVERKLDRLLEQKDD